MSGHSKWSGIKHKKTLIDIKKGKIFTKIIREIIIATKNGGPKVDNNARLRNAIECAKEVNMPRENIKKAIARGNGKLDGNMPYTEIIYEGYGPGGIAIIIEIITDNKNRTIANLRKIFAKHKGSIVESGGVSWLFDKKGQLIISKTTINEENILNMALEFNAEDCISNGNTYKIIIEPSQLEIFKNYLKDQNLNLISAKIIMVPKNKLIINDDNNNKALQLLNELKEYDDVKNIYTNLFIQ
ncbi:MAG: YebC/PmpR family DNA-binding transcriptional regulator [Endomicrobium sp.]|jgi:YebC/PmpR family DNA-binding regulatory protein|nr:YebC/PmpR family DNA-binding transcriptional regulator [Endomicrobium sp.]